MGMKEHKEVPIGEVYIGFPLLKLRGRTISCISTSLVSGAFEIQFNVLPIPFVLPRRVQFNRRKSCYNYKQEQKGVCVCVCLTPLSFVSL